MISGLSIDALIVGHYQEGTKVPESPHQETAREEINCPTDNHDHIFGWLIESINLHMDIPSSKGDGISLFIGGY